MAIRDSNRHSTPIRALDAATAVLATVMATVSAGLIVFKLARQPLFVDFLTMWTGGRIATAAPVRLYDQNAIDRAQAWLMGAASRDRPFPYPPSALLAFSPLARLPFWTAAWVWLILGVAAFALACAQSLPRRRRWLSAGLLVTLPAAAWAAVSGQCTFLAGAAAIVATVMLERRPILAGALLGAAAALKPSILIMAPVALAAARAWRALTAAASVGAAALALSLALFGAGPWIAWLRFSTPWLAHMAADPRYASALISPGALAGRIGLTGYAAVAWRAAFAAAGVALAAAVFGRVRRLDARLVALFGASLLASPYAMNYESLLLAPGAAIALARAEEIGPRARALAAYAVLALAGLPNVGVFAFIAFLTLACPWAQA